MLHKEKAASGFKNDQNGKVLGIFKPIKPVFLSMTSLHEPPKIIIETPKWIARNTSELIDLLNDSDCSRCNLTTDFKNVKMVKFLLTIQNELVFGPCGNSHPENNIPAYPHLAAEEDFYNAQCITAGNAYFTDSNELIALGSHCMEFPTSFHSLQFALPHFLCLELPISDSFRLCETNLSGVFLRWHFIERSTLEKYARENLCHKEDINSFSSLEKKEVEEQKKFTANDILFFASKQTPQKSEQPHEPINSPEKQSSLVL
ncbi:MULTISPECIES: hypothetical protein [Legionella]|uniref:hypothetical protein n=1 Tax=Legionella TaxID=445 RepID=UPI00096561E4|nr:MULTISPECIES: hypothetical protein [Legionella]MBN9227009.1 hypothetical protein [Legionella steelei]OJW14114.1 MAG: hypothetical protein BGO44_09200 [Legionella sp. 39-23]